MKRFFFATTLCVISLSILAGCGTPEPTNIIDGKGEKAILDYEAMVKADADAMNASMKAERDASKGGAETAKAAAKTTKAGEESAKKE